MKAKRSVAAASLVLAVSGCMELTPDTVGKQTPGQICYSIAVARAGNANRDTVDIGIAELRRRGELRETDLFAIETGELRVGLKEEAAICLMGGLYDQVNETTTARGTERQYVFPHPYNTARPVTYIYTRGGVVTAFQD